MIEVVADGAEASIRSGHLIETQLVPALLRASAAMEGTALGRQGSVPSASNSNSNRVAGEIREAILERRFGRADHLLQIFLRDDPKSTELPTLLAELDRARRAEADDLHVRLDVALAADDADRVISCRDALTQHLSGEPLKNLDQRVVRWIADRVQTQVREGTVTSEVVALATRAADSFGDTTEGVALLAALPKLRRRAGLCPRCEAPYRGRDSACPDCLAEETEGSASRSASGRSTPKGSR